MIDVYDDVVYHSRPMLFRLEERLHEFSGAEIWWIPLAHAFPEVMNKLLINQLEYWRSRQDVFEYLESAFPDVFTFLQSRFSSYRLSVVDVPELYSASMFSSSLIEAGIVPAACHATTPAQLTVLPCYSRSHVLLRRRIGYSPAETGICAPTSEFDLETSAPVVSDERPRRRYTFSEGNYPSFERQPDTSTSLSALSTGEVMLPSTRLESKESPKLTKKKQPVAPAVCQIYPVGILPALQVKISEDVKSHISHVLEKPGNGVIVDLAEEDQSIAVESAYECADALPMERNWEAFAKAFPSKEPRYAFFNFPFRIMDGGTTRERSIPLFLHWTPDAAKIKKKTILAASTHSFLQVLPHDVRRAEVHDVDELEYSSIRGRLVHD